VQRHSVSGDEAFAKLVRTSQDANTRLRDVAHPVDHAERTAAEPRLNRPEVASGNGFAYAAGKAAS